MLMAPEIILPSDVMAVLVCARCDVCVITHFSDCILPIKQNICLILLVYIYASVCLCVCVCVCVCV
jgi:hypothetical protein